MRSEKDYVEDLELGDRAFVKLDELPEPPTPPVDPDRQHDTTIETTYQAVRIVEINRAEGYYIVSRGRERMVCEPRWLRTYAPDDLVQPMHTGG